MFHPLARTNTAWWSLACLFVFAFYFLTTPSLWQCEGVDEIEYLSLAHSLAHGEGYTVGGRAHVLYPPLFPSLLSLGMGEGIPAWAALYRVNALAGLAAVVLGASWLRRFGSSGVFAAWLGLFSYYAWSFSTRYLLSDPLSALLNVGLLMVIWRVLNRNRAAVWEYALIAVVAWLCAMTRFGSISLFAAVALAGFIRWWGTRVRVGLLVAVLVLLFGGGFTLYWEIHAAVTDPSAVESYGRWALRLIGLSHETTGIIAKNTGEGTAESTSWPARIVATGLQSGRYVASLVRMPANSSPLALFLGVLVAIGVLSHLQRTPWSPMGWYVAVSLGVISLTSWISSYPRYLYALTPFLFFFLALGAKAWLDGLSGSSSRWVSSVTILWGVGGIGWSMAKKTCMGVSSGEEIYLSLVTVVCVAVYSVLVLLGWKTFFSKTSLTGNRIPLFAFGIIFLYGIYTAAVAVTRFRATQDNAGLEARHLVGAVMAGQWLHQNSDPTDRVFTSLPKMMVFLTDRRCVTPDYDASGRLVETNLAPFAMALGPLREVPPFRAAEEDRWTSELADTNRWEKIYTSGDARVFRLKSCPQSGNN